MNEAGGANESMSVVLHSIWWIRNGILDAMDALFLPSLCTISLIFTYNTYFCRAQSYRCRSLNYYTTIYTNNINVVGILVSKADLRDRISKLQRDTTKLNI